MTLIKEMEYGDIKVDNHNSYYIGRHIIRNGDRPQPIYRAYDPMTQFYQSLFDEAGVDVDKSVTMSGCFKSNKITLQRTAIPNVQSDFSGLPTINKILKFSNAVRSTIRKLRITKIPTSTIDDLKYVAYNTNTFPGFYYKEYLNLKTKGEASEIAMNIALKR